VRRTRDSWNFNSIELVDDNRRLYRFGIFYSIPENLDSVARHPALMPSDG